MGKALVIVESPAKAKTITKYLGSSYIVKSSIGHIRDLPTRNKKSLKNKFINRLGFDPYQEWKANYEILPDKEKIITELKLLAAQADHIYLATDFDREGEAIAWHLREVLGGNDDRFSRVIFNEITKNAINQAFAKPVKINIDQVNAQQARRFMDRIVGYMISPLLWKKIARGLSAGRVQSVAVRLVVERERAIKTFVPTEYWKIHVELESDKSDNLIMKVTHEQEKHFKPVNKKQIETALSLLKNAEYRMIDRDDNLIINKPSPPFITSTLHQAASLHLGYNVKKTMKLAQRLYETGYITYIRTDSTNLSQEAIHMVRCYINNVFGSKYLPKQHNLYCDGTKSQEHSAHEAIRPSDINIIPDHLIGIEEDVKKLYQLIWCKFIACQMTPAQYDSTTITVNAGPFILRTYGRKLRFDGWTKIMPIKIKHNDEELPTLEIGQKLMLKKLLPSKHLTKPKVRYNEASLIKEMEKLGIGRPSTYASIISAIQERGYVHLVNRRLYAEKIGEIVTDRLKENFSDLVNYEFTANMEYSLDQIANNKKAWKNVLDDFFSKFILQLENANKDPNEGGMRPNIMVMTNIDCPICGRHMGIRVARTGIFLGCSGYTSKQIDRCKHTMNLISETTLKNFKRRHTEDEEKELDLVITDPRCKICGTLMDKYFIDSHRLLYICGNHPGCDNYEIEEGALDLKNYSGMRQIMDCNKCSSEMHLEFRQFGTYLICKNTSCNNHNKILRNSDIAQSTEAPIPLPELLCEKSDAYFVLRDSALGVFLSSHTFPKHRETRAPLVEELVRFKDRLPQKLRYLADAPVHDPQGNKTIVRFNRKTKQQYVSSDKKCNANWKAFFIDGHWKVQSS